MTGVPIKKEKLGCRRSYVQGGCHEKIRVMVATAKGLLEARREAGNRSFPIIFRGSMVLSTP